MSSKQYLQVKTNVALFSNVGPKLQIDIQPKLASVPWAAFFRVAKPKLDAHVHLKAGMTIRF